MAHEETQSILPFMEAKPAFRMFRIFNNSQYKEMASSRHRLDHHALPLFSSQGFPERIVRALAETGLVKLKEVLESFEFFERVRRRLRASVVADLCCGHGLTGMLFAIFERDVERVVLLDKREPQLFQPIFNALCEQAPWIKEKVVFHQEILNRAADYLAPGASIIGVHACGKRTDGCIEAAIKLRGSLAVMPCCYGQTGQGAPCALKQSLGVVLATDVERTYRLEQANFQVSWSAIPQAITPMNRIIAAHPHPMG